MVLFRVNPTFKVVWDKNETVKDLSNKKTPFILGLKKPNRKRKKSGIII